MWCSGQATGNTKARIGDQKTTPILPEKKMILGRRAGKILHFQILPSFFPSDRMSGDLVPNSLKGHKESGTAGPSPRESSFCAHMG